MKFCYLFFTFSLTLAASASEFRSPDILIDTKLDYDWSSVMVTKFRTLLKNYNMNDPFKGRFTQPIMVNQSQVGDLLPVSSKNLIRDFGNAVGLSILNAETKVWMHDFSYDVKGFKTDLKDTVTLSDGLLVDTNFSASEVNLTAKKVSLSLVIPGKNGSPVLNVDIINPVIRASEEKLVTFFAKIKIEDQKDAFKLIIQKANFDQMAKGLLANSRDIVLDYERLEIPQVSLKIGNKTINFDKTKIQQLVRNNHEAIKGILLAQAGSMLKANTVETAFKVLEQYKINKEYWMATDVLQSQIKLSHFTSAPDGENIEVNMPGDFCTLQNYDKHKQQCVNNKITQIAPTRLNRNTHGKSVEVMRDLMARGDANIVASISEDYLNKLLVATYDAGLWKEALDEAGVALGPNRVIMKLDKRGDSGTLIMDVIYKPTKLERVLTGSKQIRFPLILDVSVRVEKHDGEPVVIVRLNDVDTTDQTLIHGRPEEGVQSNVKDVPRFKGKIAKAIRSRVISLKQKDILELRYPEFKGLGLEKVDFLSDGQGRMNATMRLEDLLEEQEEAI